MLKHLGDIEDLPEGQRRFEKHDEALATFDRRRQGELNVERESWEKPNNMSDRDKLIRHKR